MERIDIIRSERDLLIQRLVIDCVERLDRNPHSLWLHTILESGFTGFANMSAEELGREIARRGLRLEEPCDERQSEDFDDDPDEDEDDLLHCAALACPSGASGLA